LLAFGKLGVALADPRGRMRRRVDLLELLGLLILTF